MNKKLKCLAAVPVAGLIAGLAACGTTHPVTKTVPGPSVTSPTATPDPSSAEAAWATQYGLSATHSLSADLSKIQADASNGNVTALTKDAGTLSADIQAAQSDPPPPVDAADWNTALADLNVGATDIMTSDYTDAITEFSNADTALANLNSATNASN